MKGCILPFSKKGDLRLAKNYWGITLTSIVAKIYNALLHNCIEPKIENILRENQNVFWRNRSTTSQILTICRILEGVNAKNLEATLLFVDFTKTFDSIHKGKMEQILLAYSSLKLVDKFTYQGSSVSSTETDINTWLAKAWTAIDRLLVIWKSDRTDKIKISFFEAAVVSILLYGCTTWTLTKHMEKSLRAITQECCEQYWRSHGGSTPQNNSCTATYHPSRKLSKSDEPDVRDTAGEVGMSL